MVNTNMTHVFKHPKFYRIPRDKSDQVISSRNAATVAGRRAPGPGLKATSFKLQASSFRTNLFKHQATSVKPQAASVKLQAASYKFRDPRTTVHGYWRSFRGTRTKGLGYDKCILRMTFMEGNLMW